MSERSSFDFNGVIDRRVSDSEKWDKYEERDLIPMWLADMDFRSPPAVMEALHRRVEHGIFGYTHAPDELADVIVSALFTSYGWKAEKEWLVWMPGLVTGLNVTCRAVGNDGDGVITTVPVYPPFLSAPGQSRRELIRTPMVHSSGKWTFDFDRLESALTPRTRLLLLCNPHNPVGRIFSKEELETLAALCDRHNVVICSDEIHCGLILDRDKAHIPTATLSPAIAARTITLMSPSKTYNLPGLGIAFAVIPDPHIRRSFQKTMAGIVPSVNALAYAAALAAYREGAEWLDALLVYLGDNRDLIESEVHRMPGLSVSHAEATYQAWIDTRSTGLVNPSQFFEQAGVGLASGHYFGSPGFVRLSFGTSRVLLRQALDRMKRAMESLSTPTGSDT